MTTRESTSTIYMSVYPTLTKSEPSAPPSEEIIGFNPDQKFSIENVKGYNSSPNVKCNGFYQRINAKMGKTIYKGFLVAKYNHSFIHLS